MKKILYFAAMAALLLVSCNQDEPKINEPEKKTDAFTFKASIEDLATSGNAGSSSNVAKATINGSYGLNWATGDLIGIYFPDWGDKNQPFRLDPADNGKTEGSFAIATAADPSGASATAAYFPWWDTDNYNTTYPSSSQTNVYEGIVYFKMKNEYWSYSNEKMLTPLVASISKSSDNISFKHAGAAVKLTVNNLVSGTYKVKMSVEGKQITGDFHVNPANAGTDALTLDAAEDVSKNHITLNSWKGSGAFSWIFPVPALSTPKLTFEIIDANGITVWSKSPKAQSSVGRAGLLVMPARDITPYEKFVQDDEVWTFSGNINGSDWVDNIPMMTDGKYSILSGFTFAEGDQFKIRKNKDWAEAYPAGNWEFTAGNAGTKDIIFNHETNEIRVVDHTFPYPTVKLTTSITINGTFADWAIIPGSTSGNHTLKVASDNDYIYVYSNRASDSRWSEIWGAGYFYVAFDTDNNSTTGTGTIYGNGPYEFIALLYPYAGDSDNPAFNTTKQNNWQCQPTGTSLSNVTLAGDASDGAVFEFRIPRTDLPTIPTSSITVKAWGDKGLSTVTLNCKL